MRFSKIWSKKNARSYSNIEKKERSFDQVIFMSKDHAGVNKSRLDVVIRLGLTLDLALFPFWETLEPYLAFEMSMRREDINRLCFGVYNVKRLDASVFLLESLNL